MRRRFPHARFCTLGVLALALALSGCPAHRSAPSVRSVVPANRQTPNAASAPRAPTRGVRFSALRDGAIVPWDWEPSLGLFRVDFAFIAESRQRICLLFNEPVVPEQVFPYITLGISAEGDSPVVARDITLDDPARCKFAGEAAPTSHVVSIAPKDYPSNRTVAHLRVRAGAPALSPGTSLTKDYSTELDVRELPPFALESSHAFSVDRPHPIELTFTRSLVNESDLAHAIHVSPVVRNFKAGFSAYGTVVLDGDFVGNTRYTIQIDSSLEDKDGSAIEPTTVVVQTPSVVPTLYGDRPLVHSALSDFEDRRTFIAPLNALPFYSINHGPYRVRVHAVTPADFPAFRSRYEAVLHETEENRLPRMPGKVVFDGTVTPATLPERILETPIPLAGALPGGVGHAIVEVIGAPQAPEPAPKLTYAADDPVLEYRESLSRKNHYLKWIEATNLGLSVSNRDGYGSAWVTSLDRGIPLAAKLRFGKDSAVTGAGGTASLRFGAPGDLVVATRGDDSTFVHGSFGSAPRNPLSWLVFDDKRRYREGDLVRIKGWIRGPKGDVPRAQRGAVKWNVVDAEAKGSVDLDAFGSFDLSFSLPHRELPSGQSHEFIEFSYAGQIMDHEIALSVEAPSQRTEYFLVGDSVTVTRTTKDEVGRGRLNVPAEWGVHVTSTWFTPPGWESFSFGNDSGDTRREQEFLQIAACGRNEEHASYFSFNSRTDASGTAAMKIDFLPQTPPQALRVAVDDRNMVVHPASVYVGLRLGHNYVALTDAIDVDAIAVSPDGVPFTGQQIDVSIAHAPPEHAGHVPPVPTPVVGRCQAVSTLSAARCTLPAMVPGEYIVSARVRDNAGRENESDVRLRVVGSPRSDVARSKNALTVTLDHDSYAPGDSARAYVESATYPGEGIAVISNALQPDRVIPFHITSPGTRVDFPIDPNFAVRYTDLRVHAVFANGESLDSPALALRVEPLELTLRTNVDATDPNGATVHATLTDRAGVPQSSAALSFAAVDLATDAACAQSATLNEAWFPDPQDDWHSFFAGRPGFASSRANVNRPPPDRAGLIVSDMTCSAPGASLQVQPSPLWLPTVLTDARGTASVRFPLPPTPGRFRIVAYATTGRFFAKSEAIVVSGTRSR